MVVLQWFETPVDAELFEHMAKACPEFQQVIKNVSFVSHNLRQT
jgi:hypothetical protein